jgi:hypothetical protein
MNSWMSTLESACVGAQLGLVRGAVELDQLGVEQPLLRRLEADDLGPDVVDDDLDGVLHALTGIPLAAVAEFGCLERAGGCPARHARAGDRAVVEEHLHLDRGIPPGIEDLACAEGFDGGHSASP